MNRHEFGGTWTQLKLKLLEKYLNFFTTALSSRFRLHYVDAFAGTGKQSHKEKNKDQLLLEQNEFTEMMKGSATLAMDCNPPFNMYHFNDNNPEHVECLEALVAEKGRKANICRLDANIFIENFCSDIKKHDDNRAVIFIDPYSIELDWKTLKAIANTGKADVWLLFPISTLLRMTPNKGHKDEWGPRIDRFLGIKEWKDALYVPRQNQTDDLFAGILNSTEYNSQQQEKERIDHRGVAQFVTRRLREIFPYVNDPVWLDKNNAPFFLFYFCVSNSSKAARDLAEKVVNSITRQYRR